VNRQPDQRSKAFGSVKLALLNGNIAMCGCPVQMSASNSKEALLVALLRRLESAQVRVVADAALPELHTEWVTVSLYDVNFGVVALPVVLPLFPALDRWAA
jgi:hypothetical protein